MITGKERDSMNDKINTINLEAIDTFGIAVNVVKGKISIVRQIAGSVETSVVETYSDVDRVLGYLDGLLIAVKLEKQLEDAQDAEVMAELRLEDLKLAREQSHSVMEADFISVPKAHLIIDKLSAYPGSVEDELIRVDNTICYANLLYRHQVALELDMARHSWVLMFSNVKHIVNGIDKCDAGVYCLKEESCKLKDLTYEIQKALVLEKEFSDAKNAKKEAK